MSEAMSLQEAQLLFAPVEAILMVVDQPVTSEELGRVLHLSPEDMESVLHMLAAEYSGAQGGRDHGFELRRFGGGWRIYSSARWESLVSQFIVGAGQSKLSQAALETLAVIAYRRSDFTGTRTCRRSWPIFFGSSLVCDDRCFS